MPDLPPDRLLPHPARAEQRLLASIMLDATPRVAEVFKQVRPADFLLAQHRTVFGVLCELNGAGAPTDAMAVRDRLVTAGLLDGVGGIEYLAEVLASVPNANHALDYARRVREAADRRGEAGN